jgi:hypothetical protein
VDHAVPINSIEAVAPNGHCLRVDFHWRNDRYGHVVSLVGTTGEVEPLLASIEGLAEENWPPSPPLQSLSVETLPNGRPVALLVGMAGGTHWSASIEPLSGTAELLFDIACRHSSAPQRLGSQYRRLPTGAKSVKISGEAAQIAEKADQITIEPASASASSTQRWKYVVHVNPEP